MYVFEYQGSQIHMNTKLNKIQTEGVHWLLEKEKAILGDAMGLGKTLQMITVLMSLLRQGSKNPFPVNCLAEPKKKK